MTKIPLKPKNYQNNHETYKMTKIPPEPKKWPKYSWNLKITKIITKPTKWPNTPKNSKNDQNMPEIKKKITKIPPET